MTAALLL